MPDEFVALTGEPVAAPDPGEVTIICMPTSRGPSYVPASAETCTECGAGVWVTIGGSEERMRMGGATLLCLDCFSSRTVSPDEIIAGTDSLESARRVRAARRSDA